MTDWKKTTYGTPKSWEDQQREKAKEDFERKYPLTWWDNIRIPLTAAITLILGTACIIGLLYWIFSAPFAR